MTVTLSHNSFFTPSSARTLKEVLTNVSTKMPGLTTYGDLTSSISNFLKGHDRFHNSSYLPQMVEQIGNVYITKPKLNLSSPNLSYDRVMAPLNTLNPMSSAFMIRCLLDTHFAAQHLEQVENSPLLNKKSPFLIPACNGLIGISGWPDITIETATTEGGYFSENQTYVTGYDRLYKTYNFNLTFKDIPSSPVFNLFFYWLNYMANVTLGDMVSYNFHIDAQRLDYTVSIYEFIMDPTRRYILKWAKATGCFPVSLPIGDIFNFSEGSHITEGSGKFTVPFIVNNVKYNDYLRIIDFNILAERYCSSIREARVIKFNSPYNYVGVPYIVSTPKGFILTHRDVDRVLPEEELETESTFASSSSYKIQNLAIYKEIERTGFNLANEEFYEKGYANFSMPYVNTGNNNDGNGSITA